MWRLGTQESPCCSPAGGCVLRHSGPSQVLPLPQASLGQQGSMQTLLALCPPCGEGSLLASSPLS